MQKSIHALILCFSILTAQTAAGAQELTLMTWNIQVGYENGILQNKWNLRKALVLKQISSAKADIYCLQEVSADQRNYLLQQLPTYSQFGKGRDDGKNKGEHCLLLFNKEFFEFIKGDTFWLSDTPDTSKNTWDFPFKRICTWVSLHEKKSGKTLFIFNTHFPLNPLAQPKAAQLVQKRIDKIIKKELNPLVMVCGDFNCDNKSEAWKIFEKAGYKPISTAKSITVMDKPFACTDTIFIGANIKPSKIQTNLLRSKTGTYASDHFSIQAKLKY
ncbi:MAG: endonuclease/exonuclease/phosphatase family protein [Candidatus Melainabacteria bacterium]|nr:endonuclease/exonuclease/phosphatase family protein [Candidatus Melainabacteria bacterium]